MLEKIVIEKMEKKIVLYGKDAEDMVKMQQVIVKDVHVTSVEGRTVVKITLTDSSDVCVFCGFDAASPNLKNADRFQWGASLAHKGKGVCGKCNKEIADGFNERYPER